MQAKGQAVRSDALARYGVQIGQKLRHVDYAASGLGKFFAGVLSCLTVSDWRRDVRPIRLCLLGEPRPGRHQAVKAEAAKRGRDSASLCVGHVRQLGGESPLCNLMEVKH
jgi:hypothetical protein